MQPWAASGGKAALKFCFCLLCSVHPRMSPSSRGPCCFFIAPELLSSSCLSSQSFYSSEILLCGSVQPLLRFQNLIFLKNRSSNKKQIEKVPKRAMIIYQGWSAEESKKALVHFALWIHIFPHSLLFLMPLCDFQRKCLFLVLCTSFPLFSSPARKKKQNASQICPPRLLAHVFWQ